MLNLVTDRAANAPDALKSLNRKKYAQMTSEERALWDYGNGGAYDAEDLKRVESAVEFLSVELERVYNAIKDLLAQSGVADDNFFSIPYKPEDLVFFTKTDWEQENDLTPEDTHRFLENVKKICSLIEYTRPPLPNTMNGMGIDGANNIEKSLQGLEIAAVALEAKRKNQIDRAANSWYYSGELYGGENA